VPLCCRNLTSGSRDALGGGGGGDEEDEEGGEDEDSAAVVSIAERPHFARNIAVLAK
jgi:hypothetical protein